MIEIIILNHLENKISVPVFLETPERPPKSYVLIEKTGGAKINYINSAIVAFKSVAESLFLAANLNEEVKTAVESSICNKRIGKVELNSDYNFTDLSTKKYRYQAVYEIKYY